MLIQYTDKKMVNGLHLYSAFTDPMATKALYILPHIHPFTNSLIHTPDSDVSHARRYLARQEQMELGILPTWFVDNQHEPLSHCRPPIH